MPKQFKTARQINKLWEGERKSPSIDSLENMADLYGVTTDFLLGRSDTQRTDSKKPIPLQALPAIHMRQADMACRIWMAAGECHRQAYDLSHGRIMPFSDIIGALFRMAPPFSEADPPDEPPLSRSEVKKQKKIWLEPISPDSDLRKELQDSTREKTDLLRMSMAACFSCPYAIFLLNFGANTI